jgi:homocysteine S-methyltransferase
MIGRFRALLDRGSAIVFDGGPGTTLSSRGVSINRCFDQLNLEQPELGADLHREFVDAGAMVPAPPIPRPLPGEGRGDRGAGR